MNGVDIGTPPVLDGTLGNVIAVEVDGEPALLVEQPTLIEVSLDDLVHDLVVIDRRLGDALDDLTDLKARVKNLKEAREQILSRMKDQDAGTTLLPFEPGPDETFDGDEPGDDLG